MTFRNVPPRNVSQKYAANQASSSGAPVRREAQQELNAKTKALAKHSVGAKEAARSIPAGKGPSKAGKKDVLSQKFATPTIEWNSLTSTLTIKAMKVDGKGLKEPEKEVLRDYKNALDKHCYYAMRELLIQHCPGKQNFSIRINNVKLDPRLSKAEQDALKRKAEEGPYKITIRNAPFLKGRLRPDLLLKDYFEKVELYGLDDKHAARTYFHDNLLMGCLGKVKIVEESGARRFCGTGFEARTLATYLLREDKLELGAHLLLQEERGDRKTKKITPEEQKARYSLKRLIASDTKRKFDKTSAVAVSLCAPLSPNQLDDPRKAARELLLSWGTYNRSDIDLPSRPVLHLIAKSIVAQVPLSASKRALNSRLGADLWYQIVPSQFYSVDHGTGILALARACAVQPRFPIKSVIGILNFFG